MCIRDRYVTLPVNSFTKQIVGEDKIIDTFYRPYTKKMWDKEIEELDPNIWKRVAIRDDDNEYYFPDSKYNIMPKHGYTKIFEEILDHPRIAVYTNKVFEKDSEDSYNHVFNSMAIDEYYDYSYGRLPYRSIKFHNVNIPMVRALPLSLIHI